MGNLLRVYLLQGHAVESLCWPLIKYVHSGVRYKARKPTTELGQEGTGGAEAQHQVEVTPHPLQREVRRTQEY